MDVFSVQDDGNTQLLASGVDAGDAREIEEWWRYTKPFGASIKIVLRPPFRTIVGLSTAGTEPELARVGDSRHSETFIG